MRVASARHQSPRATPSRRGSAPPSSPSGVTAMTCRPLVKSNARDLMTDGVERGGEGIPCDAGLEQDGLLGAAEIDERAACRIEAPIDQGDDGLDVEDDDRRAAGAAQHDSASRRRRRRRWSGPWRCAGACPARRDWRLGFPSSSTGSKGEVGELVVEQEAAHHGARAEGLLDARGHGDSIAVVVDDGDMARAAALLRARRRPNAPCFMLGGVPATTFCQRAVGIDQSAALGEIGRIEQTSDRTATKSESAR